MTHPRRAGQVPERVPAHGAGNRASPAPAAGRPHDRLASLCRNHREKLERQVANLLRDCPQCLMHSLAVERERTFRRRRALSHAQVWDRQGQEVKS